MQATVDTSGVKVSSQQVRLQTGLRGVCLDGPLLDQCANLRSIALCLGKIWSGKPSTVHQGERGIAFARGEIDVGFDENI